MIASLLPGRGYSPEHPLLHFTARLLESRGYEVRPLRWGPLPEDPGAWPGHVRDVVAEHWEREGTPSLAVGKSLGAHALPLAAERGVPGIWLTPLLDDAANLAALGPGHLVVGGTADPFWDDARPTPGARRLVVDGADHALEVPGDVFGSVTALATVLHTVEDFLRERSNDSIVA